MNLFGRQRPHSSERSSDLHMASVRHWLGQRAELALECSLQPNALPIAEITSVCLAQLLPASWVG